MEKTLKPPGHFLKAEEPADISVQQEWLKFSAINTCNIMDKLQEDNTERTILCHLQVDWSCCEQKSG